MMWLPVTMVLLANPNPSLLYEQKCLYCHSDEMPQHPDFTAEDWARTVERMRAKAQLLITRSDARALTRYIQTRLHLKPAPTPRAAPSASVTPGATETKPIAHVIDLTPLPTPKTSEAGPADDAAREAREARAEALDQQGSELMAARCSKCHTLTRVFGKLDSLDRSLSTLARMRAKTGSAITHDDAQRLEQFLRSQFAPE